MNIIIQSIFKISKIIYNLRMFIIVVEIIIFVLM